MSEQDILGLLAAVTERLDKQARAIVALRAQVKALRDSRDTSVSPKGDETVSFIYAGTKGNYVPNPKCMVCGTAKGPLRTELTCVSCGRERNTAIREGGSVPNYTECGNCGQHKSATRNLLDPQCSRSFAEWKAAK